MEDLVKKLVENLKSLKVKCESKESEELRVQIRSIIDRLRVEHEYNIEELSYLLDYAALQRLIGNKINKVDSEVRVWVSELLIVLYTFIIKFYISLMFSRQRKSLNASDLSTGQSLFDFLKSKKKAGLDSSFHNSRALNDSRQR